MALKTRDFVVAWFHDSEEICEHDDPPPSCEIMADHLLAAFDVTVRDWKEYAAPNRRSYPRTVAICYPADE